jgi:NADH-quinone oxidoreductase subunit K
MDYVILSVTLLSIGVYGLLTRRNLLKMLVSVELIATSASMNFVLLTPSLNRALGETLLILAFSTDTCVTAVVLGVLVVVSREYETCDIGKLTELEGKDDGKKAKGDR